MRSSSRPGPKERSTASSTEAVSPEDAGVSSRRSGSRPARPSFRRFFLAPLLFSAGLIAYAWNRDLQIVYWDEFLWRPEILRVARESLPSLDWGALLHPTRWQYPPLFFVAAGALARVFGETPFSLRALSILSSSLLAPWAYLIGRLAGGGRTGAIAGLYALSLPLAHRYGAALLVDPFQASLAGLTLFLFARAECRRSSLLPAALAAVAGGLAKYTSLLLSASLVLLVLGDRFRRPAGDKRSRTEILVFALLAFSPLLLLRRGDLDLLREMSFWRSLPLEWTDLPRLFPIPLLVFALLGPFPLRRFPRALHGSGLFLLFWSAFFFWRRQQLNWLLPSAVPLAVLAAHATRVRIGGRGRVLAAAVAAAGLAYGAYRSAWETSAYRETERIYREATAFVDERVAGRGVVAVDALPFASGVYLRSPTYDVRGDAFRDARFALLIPWVFENYKVRGFSGSARGEVHETEIRRRWRLEKRYTQGGAPILEIYVNPAAPGPGTPD